MHDFNWISFEAWTVIERKKNKNKNKLKRTVDLQVVPTVAKQCCSLEATDS